MIDLRAHQRKPITWNTLVPETTVTLALNVPVDLTPVNDGVVVLRNIKGLSSLNSIVRLEQFDPAGTITRTINVNKDTIEYVIPFYTPYPVRLTLLKDSCTFDYAIIEGAR